MLETWEKQRRLEAVDEPDVADLINQFEVTHTNLSEWRERQRTNFDIRFTRWDGQADDNRKHARGDGVEPQPWDGASDIPVPFVDDYIRTDKAMCLNSLRKARVTAQPVEASDIPRASLISNYVRYMMHSQIGEEFWEQMEVACSNWLEHGLMVTGQFYRREPQKVSTPVNLFDLPRELQMVIADEEMEQTAVDALSEQLDIKKKRARKAIRELRSNGATVLPREVIVVDRPSIRAYSPDEEVFFPPKAVSDIQRAGHVFLVEYHNPRELRNKVLTEGWDEEKVEYIIENTLRGARNNEELQKRNFQAVASDSDADNTYKIIRCFQKVTDEDGVTGVYETVFTKSISETDDGKPFYLKHELRNDLSGEYPFVATPLERYSNFLYESRGYAEVAHGWQDAYKVEVDQTIDAASLATMGFIVHTPGQAPKQIGPGVRIPRRPGSSIEFETFPYNNRPTKDVREDIRYMADRFFGRENPNYDNPKESAQKKQHLVNMFLGHAKKAINQLFNLEQQFGPEQRQFQVLGTQEMTAFEKRPGERMDFFLDYDVLDEDPEYFDKKIKSIIELAVQSQSADVEPIVHMAMYRMDPVIAQAAIQEGSKARQKAEQEQKATLAELWAGVPSDVPELDSHQIKLQYTMEQYLPQPEVQRRLADDEIFAKRIERHVKQRQHQIQQQTVNPMVGRMGTQPQSAMAQGQ